MNKAAKKSLTYHAAMTDINAGIRLRPAAYALIRAYVAEDYDTAAEILRGRPGMEMLAVTAGAGANALLTATLGDRRMATAILDGYVTDCVAEAAELAAREGS